MNDMLAAAKTIASARRNRTALQPLPAAAAPRDEAEGYRIQEAVRELLAADFGALVGYKIGCTSAVMAACSPKAFTKVA
jgi:2-keto-4-pentenoate hydratase